MLVRPCFLLLDHEYAGSISTRKLVIETAKFNVISVYSCEEVLATLDSFPGVHGFVTNANITHDSCSSLLTTVRERHPRVKLVIVGHEFGPHVLADCTVESFAPAKLLSALRDLFPEEAVEVQRNEEQLEIVAQKEKKHTNFPLEPTLIYHTDAKALVMSKTT